MHTFRIFRVYKQTSTSIWDHLSIILCVDILAGRANQAFPYPIKLWYVRKHQGFFEDSGMLREPSWNKDDDAWHAVPETIIGTRSLIAAWCNRQLELAMEDLRILQWDVLLDFGVAEEFWGRRDNKGRPI